MGVRATAAARPVLPGRMLSVLVLLFGSPPAIFLARVLGALAVLCPCQAGYQACDAHHLRAGRAIAVVAAGEPDPDEAAARLLGAGAHETGFRVELQAQGGRAITYWQLEVRRADRAALLADPVAAARLALRIARACGGSMVGYAGGRCEGGPEVQQTAADLRRYVAAARLALAAQ